MNIIKNTNKLDNEFNKKITVHYTHEKLLHSFKRDTHRILENTFPKQLCDDTKLIVGNRYRHDPKKVLIRKRPKQSLLTNTTPKSKSIYFRQY